MPPDLHNVRVLLVGEDSLARNGLQTALEPQASLAVVGQATADDLGVTVQRINPDVVAWDLGLDPRPLLTRLKSASVDRVPVVALVAHERSASEAFAAGARAVLFRDAEAKRLASAIVAVSHGNVVLDEALAAAVFPNKTSSLEPPTDALTAREVEVLQLLAQGMANKTIAARLAISEHTAKFHVNAILAKLGAESRTEAVVRAARLGLVIF